MRDPVLGLMLVVIMLNALRHPWVGIMGWTWLSIMNPHVYSWRLNTYPVAMAMVVATLIGMLITRDRRQFFLSPQSVALMAFMLWICVTLPFSFNVDGSMEMFKKVMKIDFMILVTLVVLHSKKHIMAFAWVVAGSLGFYGFKGGLFTIMTGGTHRVWGPETTFIEGNNEVALALIMIIPLVRFLHLNATSVWVRRILLATMILCAAAALGSHSRGALLAIVAMGAVLWWRSEKKVTMAVLIIAAAAILIPFMPENWTERMNTIQTYDKDDSALGRINAWYNAFNVARNQFFGAGFDMYTPEIFAMYSPEPERVHAAHSIYFQVLGEHGFVGLFLFLLIWLLVWVGAGRLMKRGRLLPETRWAADLGAMVQVSLVGYAVGGAFLSLAYFDLPYNMLILVVLATRWCNNKEWVNEQQLASSKTPVSFLERMLR